MTIEARISKLEKMSYCDDEFKIAVFVGDNDGIIDCGVRRDDCPELPCKAGVNCWWKRENPHAQVINAGGDDIED